MPREEAPTSKTKRRKEKAFSSLWTPFKSTKRETRNRNTSLYELFAFGYNSYKWTVAKGFEKITMPKIAVVGRRLSKSKKTKGVPMFQEESTRLSAATMDMHRAIISLREELEAVDYYNQRVDACTDEALKAILVHNRDEEKEHAAMLLEWIRRQDPTFDKELNDYLFTETPIAHE
jgi:ferritin-like protein